MHTTMKHNSPEVPAGAVDSITQRKIFTSEVAQCTITSNPSAQV
ncbi:MAG: hypothetical protein U0905_22485 [Pirellulales bacterium]